MRLFIVIKYLLLPNSDTHRQGAAVCACPSPDQLPKGYFYHLHCSPSQDCPRLYKGAETAPVPQLLLPSQTLLFFCMTGFHVSFANVSDRIRVTPGQL